jgi:hypothetical protein
MKPTFRASSMPRTLSCYGSPKVFAKVKPRDRDDGDNGTMVHWHTADILIRDHGAIPPEGGLPAPNVAPGYVLPKNDWWMVEWSVRHVLETVPADWALMVELELSHEFDRWILTGHADVIAQSPCGKKLKGIDWKTVRVAVDPADENDQVLSYQVLLKQAWPETEEIEFTVAQMRLSFEERLSISPITGAEIDACVTSLDQRACYAMDHDNELETSLKACAWCVGCACPAIRADLQNMKLTLTPEMLAGIQSEPNDGLLADFVITARTLTRPIADATEMLHERLERVGAIIADSGQRVEGFTQNGSVEINNPIEFMQVVRTDFPTDEQLAPLVSFSTTKIKDGLATVYNIPKTSKSGDSAQSRYEAKYSQHVTQGVRKMLKIT